MSVVHGDCLEVMRGMDAGSVDAVVTDPPYHLTTGKKGGSGPASVNLNSPYGRARITTGFMGMAWDGGDVAMRPETWAEAIRVAKPGAHLLAFGGTRTSHRLACAIEDAGWEIRDTIMWVYAQGFPKSLNIGCDCTGGAVPYIHEPSTKKAKPQTECDLRPVRNADVSPSVDSREGRGEVLQPSVQEPGSSIKGREQFPSSEVWSGQPSMEGRGDVLEEAWELQTNQVRSVPSDVSRNGTEGRLHNGASSGNGDAPRKAPRKNGSGSPHQPRPERQQDREPGIVQQQRRAQAGGVGEIEVCQVCGKLNGREGWGTALKPAWEPIIVARKPLVGTVAENVQAWGTGALNIDGCRVVGPVDPYLTPGNGKVGSGGVYAAGYKSGYVNSAPHPDSERHNAKGRWPANLIHDGSEEVVGLFPNDSARFFYCAKASRAERGEGNNHPTVKPLALMRYLCRLVTPPGGLVLDPFCGSGSTGVAALQEGFRFVGIEKEAEYVAIAEARIAPVGKQPQLF